MCVKRGNCKEGDTREKGKGDKDAPCETGRSQPLGRGRAPLVPKQGVAGRGDQDASKAFDVEDLDFCEDQAADFASALHGGDAVSGRTA